MTSSDCPFCNLPARRIFYEGRLVAGLWDAFPVSPGHALIVTRRHVPTWFDATAEEQAELGRAIAFARMAIGERHCPDGFNIGVNVGEAAGQTVFHLHVHVIPRYCGDVANPRGGVRHVIPGRGFYGRGSDAGAIVELPTARLPGLERPQLPHDRSLVRGLEDPLLPHLVAHLASAEQVDIAVAFVQETGLERIQEHLRDVLTAGGRVRFLTGDYLDVTEPSALRRLRDLEGNIERRVFQTTLPAGAPGRGHSFHPKAYICRDPTGEGIAFVGSSNLTRTALSGGVEWNYRVVSSRDQAGFQDVVNSFEALFAHPATTQLTDDWITAYQSRRKEAIPATGRVWNGGIEPDPIDGVRPHGIQEEALAALEETRNVGNTAGLVVLATGLGKTWLSAFDSNRREYKRILFVAHREEILAQAMRTFRRIRPDASFGHYTGAERDVRADILFASIQTLGRNHHLEVFQRDAFDYIVVDEFHHAAARSYRRLIDYFDPKFLLGLTATPERTDGGDLLALCQENIVYRCDLGEGIRRDLLCPFHYFGVPDEVDYRNIPWRSTRFDEEALTNAVATKSRAGNALEQLRKRGGLRTLAFCVSQRHADFMSAYFKEHGVRAASVHAGETSAPRAPTLEQLAAGELDIVFAVDMFNEGVDLPALDTVLMLRPTESRVLWLQQFGRGLRKAPGKERLTVIDYIGNHRGFLLKPQALLGLGSERSDVLRALERLQSGELGLPPGCEVTYDLEVIEILRALCHTAGGDALREHYLEFRDVHGVRPSAVEMYHEGYNPRSARAGHGSWLRFVRGMDDMGEAQRLALQEQGGFLDSLEITTMVRSYKMLTLLAMLNAGAFPGEIGISDLAAGFKRLATRSGVLARECGDALYDDDALRRLLEVNPIAAWAGGRGTGDVQYFAYENSRFRTTLNVSSDVREALQELTREIADWRLAEYLDRPRAVDERAPADIVCKVSHANARPILFLPERGDRDDIPEGWTPVLADAERYEANFVKVAVNVLCKPGSEENELPGLLRRWFGPDAGRPGTTHRVVFTRYGDAFGLAPVARREGRVELWRAYSREEIPPLFGLSFSRAIWNAGFVLQSGHMFLLVTLNKGGKQESFQYQDHFFGPELFQWQSQNRTAQGHRTGQDIKFHEERGIAVHLFVRQASKTSHGRSAPFVYCGDVFFESWEGEQPITVHWRLREGVPTRLWSALGVEASAT